jgi:hypothetical protein
VSVAKKLKTAALTLVSTVVGLLLGIWIAAYLTVPGIAMSVEGDPLVLFDPEVGAIANPSAHNRRIYPAIKDRKAFAFDVYTDDRGARVDGPGQKSPAKVDVLVVGDSFTWGYALPNSETYANRIGRELNASLSNFAMASYGTTQSLQVLRRQSDLAPKLVIYGMIAHHFERNVMPCAPSYYPFCYDVSHVVADEQGKLRIAPPWSNGVRRLQQQLAGNYRNPASWLTHGIDVIHGRIEYGVPSARAGERRGRHRREASRGLPADELLRPSRGAGEGHRQHPATRPDRELPEEPGGGRPRSVHRGRRPS